MLKEAVYYARMARGLFDILRLPPPADPHARLRDQMEHRAERFLEQVRDHVFAAPDHPYRIMFEQAGCEYGDLENGVRSRGLEATLRQLRDSGVYLLHDELKGKRPMVRNGREIPGSADSFLKRGNGGHWTSRSGGSRSAGTSTPHSTAYRAYRNCYEAVLTEEFGLAGRECILLFPILPAPYVFPTARSSQHVGLHISRWFAVGGNMRDTGHYRMVTRALVAEAKLLGTAIPWPEYLPPNDFTPVVKHLEKARARGRELVVRSIASPAVRVAAAASELGVSLAGVLFLVGGEALTEAKREVIERSGAEVHSNYYISEVGTVGHGCGRMRTNCVHVFEDNIAVIAVDREAPLSGARVQSLHFTTLLPLNPRLLINAEMDDHGIVGPARCDCLFSQLGYTTQIDGIYSFGKLTGYGATLVGSDILRVLERSLPQRFGGSPADYQLVETESGGESKLVLRVNPRTGVTDGDAVHEFFLNEVRGLFGGALSVRDWRHGDAFAVVMAEPESTPAGKVLSLHLLEEGARRQAKAGGRS
jgi:hypothetical protein